MNIFGHKQLTMFKLVTANLYFRKIATNHILLETSLVVEYFSTKIVAMVTVFFTVSDSKFYICYALAGSTYKCEMFFFGFASF